VIKHLLQQATLCLLALCCLLFCGAGRAEETPAATAPESTFVRDNVPLRQIVDEGKLALPLRDARVVITKHLRQLDLYSGETLIKSYHVALGENPNGDKTQRGDGRTPEGEFYICTRNGKDSAFHIFLGLSYPAIPDATRAVNGKQITWQQYQEIRGRLASRGAPLWNTALGGWVGIHGGSDGAFAAKIRKQRNSPDWTAGCIALTDKEIEEVAAATKMGTPVTIIR
jgi:hypothetical protein